MTLIDVYICQNYANAHRTLILSQELDSFDYWGLFDEYPHSKPNPDQHDPLRKIPQTII